MEVIQISRELEEKIRQAGTVEEVIQACAEEGIQVTKEQLEAGLMPESEGGLSEDMLDNISGGGIYNIVRRIISYYRVCSKKLQDIRNILLIDITNHFLRCIQE